MQLSPFRHAPRREPNSSPRHEGAGPPSTLGGGGLVKAADVCVSGPSRAGDGLPGGEYGGDAYLEFTQSLTKVYINSKKKVYTKFT